MITVLPALLSPEQVATARALLADAPWEAGRLSAGSQAAAVKDNRQLPHECEAATRIRTMVLEAAQASPLFLSAALPLRFFTPRVNRYDPEAGAFGTHIDGAIRLKAMAGGESLYVRTDVSCTVFLSEPGEYVGGDLRFAFGAGEQRVKLPAGHAVLYPGNTLHEVTPVTRGQRLGCFFWVQSLVRSADQRQLLHEMDMQLLSLRSRLGESDETTALTGTYHNLLRMWSET